jgi:hypothetical protein
VISLRYHVVSIGAVFLALALGVVLGSTTLSDSLLAGLSGQKAQLGEQVSDLRAREAGLRARLSDADRFATGVGPLAVRDALSGRTVTLISTPDVSPSDEDAVRTLLTASGARVTGQLQLTDAFSDPNRSDQLRDVVTQVIPAGAQLPVASDPGTLSGGLLGALLLVNKDTNAAKATPAERASALTALASAGFVRSPGQLEPAQLALVLTGGAQTGASAEDRATMLARFATQLRRFGAGAVLAGADGSATGSGPVGVVRADSAARTVLSTVDDVDTAAGRIVTVLALREQVGDKAGAYGTAGNATSAAPQPTNS